MGGRMAGVYFSCGVKREFSLVLPQRRRQVILRAICFVFPRTCRRTALQRAGRWRRGSHIRGLFFRRWMRANEWDLSRGLALDGAGVSQELRILQAKIKG